ncbi:hypothetical protein BK120_19775 [Paenibacillus sp. FSL A5-0031]|uniref:ATP-binding protein n=1 Tax=Paenibacillus sp. FSL A5-0031 TaxID=1920420 RepID=UPI00096DF679|nr:ATP-binding protein [Paenibacillus sp. FSL A5-0031]OME80082.1 hypothetical protein BK120_19775 [Paenibacillus sp. FSL A5-0031]
MMKCIIENPTCDGYGQIKINRDTYEFCPCTDIHKAYEIYRQSGASKHLMFFPSQLQFNPNILTEHNGLIPFHELISTHNNSLAHMIKKRWHLILISDMGYGKTQYACTLLLLAAYQKYKSVFLDMRFIRDWLNDKTKKAQMEKQLSEADIIVIDDLGVENYTDFNLNNVINNIDAIIRDHTGLLIVTSNCKIADMKTAYPNGRITSALLKGDRKIYAFLEQSIRHQPTDEKIKQIP